MFQIAAVERVQRHTDLTHFLNFSDSGALQSARMSKIRNSGLDQYGKV